MPAPRLAGAELSLRTTLARMDRSWPACPTCGASDERSPDALGVHRCSACAIEFRPPGRMPIRRASINTRRNGETAGWIISLVIMGVLAGLAIVYGDHKASSLPSVTIEPYRPPVYNPAQFDALAHIGELQFDGPLARIPLQHEIHRSQLVDGELFATGVITATEPVEAISLEAECRDLAGAPLGVWSAVVACESLQPGERCAWMIESKVGGSVAEIEFKPTGQRSFGLAPLQLDLRSERPGEIDFNPTKQTIKFEIRDHTLREARATVTAYSPDGRVLGVAETRYSGRHAPGRHRFSVAVPKPADEVGSYEARIGGLQSEW